MSTYEPMDIGPIPACLVRPISPAKKAAATRALRQRKRWNMPPDGMTSVRRSVSNGQSTVRKLHKTLGHTLSAGQIRAALHALERCGFIIKVGGQYLPHTQGE